MSEKQIRPTRSKKQILIFNLVAGTVFLLSASAIAGTAFSNNRTAELCTIARSEANLAATAVREAQKEAEAVRAAAEGTERYTTSDEGSALINSLNAAFVKLNDFTLDNKCDSKTEAEEIQAVSKDATSKTITLTDATRELNADLSDFQEIVKRAAEEKASAEAEAKKAEAIAAAAEEVRIAEEQKIAAEAPSPSVPQYEADYRLNAPQGPGHTTYVPAPAPYVPAPAPAPAPGGGGGGGGDGWTPPPLGSGAGSGCIEVDGRVICG